MITSAVSYIFIFVNVLELVSLHGFCGLAISLNIPLDIRTLHAKFNLNRDT